MSEPAGRHYPVPPGGWRHRLDDELLGTDRPAEVMKRLRDLAAAIEAVRQRFAGVSGVHPTDLRALTVLGHRWERPMTMGELGRQLDLTSGAVTGLVDRLERAGHVERVPDRSDRRRVRLRVTESADALAGAFFSGLAVRLRSVCESFSDDELEVVERFLARVIPEIAEHEGGH